jgi:preprotein translocase subunit YajC
MKNLIYPILAFIYTATYAFAEETSGTEVGDKSLIGSLLPLLLMFVIFYMLILRPQQKKYKDQTQMLSKLSINDKVVTVGGAIGTISDMKDDIITIKFHDSKIDFYQSSITKNLTQEEKKNAKK